MEVNKAIETMEFLAFSLSMSGHHDHADKLLEALAPIKRFAVEHGVQLTDGGHAESDNESTPATIGN